MVDINSQNGMYIAGGLVAFMFASKLPLKQIAKYGGLAAAALGIADVLGVFKISQFLGMIPSIPIPNFSFYASNSLPYGYQYTDYPERY